MVGLLPHDHTHEVRGYRSKVKVVSRLQGQFESELVTQELATVGKGFQFWKLWQSHMEIQYNG